MNMRSYTCCALAGKRSDQVSSLSSLPKLVGEESRLKILCILRQGQHCVCEIEEHVDRSQSLISHHLRVLKKAGLIEDEKRGLWVYYALTERGARVINALFDLK